MGALVGGIVAGMSRTRLLTDEMWARIEPLLPDRAPRSGGRWGDHRPVVEAVCWRFRTGSPWRDLPSEFPAWQTVWWRFDRWAKDGTWDRVLTAWQGDAHASGELEWLVSIDSTIARAHQHAAAHLRATQGDYRITRFCCLSATITPWVARAVGGARRHT
jgi:transposase